MGNCITFQAWVYIGAHACTHTAQIFCSEQDLTSLTKPHQVLKRDDIESKNNYLRVKLYNYVFCDNINILKLGLINCKVMNKIVPNTWAHSKVRDLRVLQYSMSGQDQGVYNSLFLLLSLFSMPHFLQKVNPGFWAGQDLQHLPARTETEPGDLVGFLTADRLRCTSEFSNTWLTNIAILLFYLFPKSFAMSKFTAHIF